MDGISSKATRCMLGGSGTSRGPETCVVRSRGAREGRKEIHGLCDRLHSGEAREDVPPDTLLGPLAGKAIRDDPKSRNMFDVRSSPEGNAPHSADQWRFCAQGRRKEVDDPITFV